MAAESAPTRAWPPHAYRLDGLTVRILLEPGHGLPRQALTLSGAGSASFERDGRTMPYQVGTTELLGVVNSFYRIRFFDLPDQLQAPRSVFLKDDGSVGTQAMKMHDATTTKVCFAVTDFEKCVTYEASPPPELAGIVQHLLAHARQRTQAAAPPE